MNDWNPMETAPEDARLVLVICGLNYDHLTGDVKDHRVFYGCQWRGRETGWVDAAGQIVNRFVKPLFWKPEPELPEQWRSVS